MVMGLELKEYVFNSKVFFKKMSSCNKILFDSEL